ncbi:50S ribosomal protein L31e [Methanocella sp. CWC-04]|uniref:Large ribosomal subunit protein eL31 n=1 Tax=Methanooceanicella nereidis TaxID=2052831 RepID=A0AAP2RDL8_9EURY|nr:50S ribosomal protein L31e [Methanocella sp. CWC-04]MCD1295329.1 50S ribosomal protein L31e [Methanocella sp. CWC-04]
MAENEKTTGAVTEQIYTIPLREVKNYPTWKKSNKAVKVIREYLSRHMKVDESSIRINKSLNEAVWSKGIEKPPSKVRVKAIKAEDGIVEADVIGSE